MSKHRISAIPLMLAFLASQSWADSLPMLVPPHQDVAGQSQAEWSRAWWQWAASFTYDSPVADSTGQWCHLKQGGPVWFLAGTYGTRLTVRTCRIPGGKHLFFPLVNSVVHPGTSFDKPSCAAVTRSAKLGNDSASALVLDLDGVQAQGLQAHRQATRTCFDLGALADSKEVVYPSAADGYYVMLKPLKPGTYELSFGGASRSTVQAVTYRLIVE